MLPKCLPIWSELSLKLSGGPPALGSCCDESHWLLLQPSGLSSFSGQ